MATDTQVTTALVIAGSTSAGQYFGLDPISIIWGFAGGFVALATQGSQSVVKSLYQVVASAVTAGALAQLFVFYIRQATDAPIEAVVPACGFLLGLTAQKLAPALQGKIPDLISAIIARVTGRKTEQ